MKVFVFLAITLLFAGLVRSEEEPDDDVTDLAEDDNEIDPDWMQHFGHHYTTVNHLVSHASGVKTQWLTCKKEFVQIERRCRVKLHRLKITYRTYTIKVRKAKHALKYWQKKYRWCLRFCWWRQSGRSHRKGDERQIPADI